MKHAFAFCLPLLLCLAPVRVHGQQERTRQTQAVPVARPSDDVPASRWAYSALHQLDEANIHTGFPTGGSRRAWTRGEFAQAIAHIAAGIVGPDVTGENTQLRQDPSAVRALRRLVNEFQPELTALGQNVPALQERLAALRPIAAPFPDVPKNHWAYQSVETLRKAGIVTGEAGGKFHG